MRLNVGPTIAKLEGCDLAIGVVGDVGYCVGHGPTQKSRGAKQSCHKDTHAMKYILKTRR